MRCDRPRLSLGATIFQLPFFLACVIISVRGDLVNEFAEPLANAVKRRRGEMGLTQEQVAKLAHTDVTNIIKMENVKRNANPELATLWGVVRALNIDPQEIFYPGLAQDSPRVRLLQQLISDCSDEEADKLIPVVRELVHFMRQSNNTIIKE